MSLADAVTSIVEEMERDIENSIKVNGTGDPIEDACVDTLRGIAKQLRLALKAAGGEPTIPQKSDVDFHRAQARLR